MAAIADDERFWDKLARKYAKDTISDMAGWERTLARTASYLRADARVLEFGCGTGTTALRLAPHVGDYRATDISGEMVKIGREKALADGAPSSLRFERGTLDDFEVEEGSLDAVLGFNALHMVADVPGAIRRIHRMLKPGGLFISKTPCLGDGTILFRVLVPAMQLIGKAPHVAFTTAAGIERDLEAAGFTIVERDWHATKGKDIRPFLVARKA